jgi:hypothetical protein
LAYALSIVILGPIRLVYAGLDWILSKVSAWNEEVWVRHTHPNGFRSGEWAELKDFVLGEGRSCYLVEFPDGVTDLWAVNDPDEPYEFTLDNPTLP